MGSAINPDGKSFAHAFDVDLVSLSHSMGLGNQRGRTGKRVKLQFQFPDRVQTCWSARAKPNVVCLTRVYSRKASHDLCSASDRGDQPSGSLDHSRARGMETSTRAD
jgi:hypothetical protein